MASNQPQAGSAPEDAWIPFIQSLYPDLLTRPYFFPPLFFNRVPSTVQNVAGLTVRVRQNPLQRISHRLRRLLRRNPPPPPPPPSTAGTVFTENPAGLQDEDFQDTDLQDDFAQHQCLQALGSIGGPMIIISQMQFRQYLDNQHNPQHNINPTNIISQLPSITHPSIPPNIADGECDIIVLSRQYGILVCEVKSVGGHPSSNQDHIIARVVAGAITQLQNQEVALKHLTHDMVSGNVRVSKAVLLPNITSAQLMAAVNSSQQLQQALVGCTNSQDTAQAIGRCLCADQLQQPGTWWSALWTGGPDPSMSDTTYERLAARFCGPASTVDIPTACQPRKVLRTFGEAVVETALRFSSLVLTPQQVALLIMQPEPQYLYLQGPPGTGKTVVLVLKALQWARQGRQVVVVSQSVNASVTILLQIQLRTMLGTAAAPPAGSILRHICDLSDISNDASRLVKLLGAGPNPDAFILFDEAPTSSDHFFQWLKAVQHRLPSVRVWAASLYRVDNDPTCPPPSWLEIREVTEPLRSPPAVISQLEGTGEIDGRRIPLYSAPALPPPTEGPPVRYPSHRDQEGHIQAGHSKGWPMQCAQCADNIGHLLTNELRVGQSGAPQYRDTWILCPYLSDARRADDLVRRLSGHHGVRVRAVSCPPSESDAEDLALALTDQVIVTDYHNVQGMERAVIVLEWRGDVHLSVSRSTSFLCVIY